MTLYGGGYEQGENSARGALTVTARVSNGSSRHAMPSIPELVYAALLYKDGASPENPESKDFAQGTETENGKLIFSFQRPDETSGITLEIFAFVKTDVVAEDGTPQFSKETALLSGNKTGLKINGDAIEVNEAIALSVSSDKPGTVSLKIKVPDGCSLELKELKIDGTTESKAHFAITGTSPNFTVKQNDENEILAGAYQVQFTVKKGTEIIHIFSEYINVINGLCTDTWSGLEKDEAKDIANSISKTVYVRGTGGWYAGSDYKDTATASDDNTGSFLSPLATIQKAVDKIIAINDGESAYTIYIDGTLDGTTAAYLDENGMADFSALTQNLTLTITAFSGTATLDGGAVFDANGNVTAGGIGKRVINAAPASGKLNLTLVNLTVTGGNASDNGGGIYFDSTSGTLTISDGTTIKGNTAGGDGGGVYVNVGKFTMTAGTISGNTATNEGGGICFKASNTLKISGSATISENKATDGGGIAKDVKGFIEMDGGEISRNTATGSGGGIYSKSGGSLTISGGTIKENEATQSGGGIYHWSASEVTISGGATISGNTAKNGGGMYVGSSLYVKGGAISGNSATGSGGGIYFNSPSAHTFAISGGATISGNTAKNGGGVYANAWKPTMSGGTISGNIASENGGGVYVTVTSTFTMSGSATISGNTASSGGGIYNSKGTFVMTGGTISGNTATNGNGAYLAATGKLNMSDAAQFAESDDVYLYASGSNIPTITVAGALEAESPPVATITPSAYTAGTQVLSASGSISEITQDICDKFALTPDPAGADWKIVPDGANGVLKTTTVYAASTGSDSNSGDRLHPFATIQKAVDTVLAMNDGADDYTIFVDGTLDGTTAALLGTNGMADFSALDKKLTLTIKSLSENAKATLDGGGRFNVAEDGTFTVTADGIKKSIIYANPTSGTLNLTLENLVITGGNTSSSGGGIYFDPANGTLTMNKCEISGNISERTMGGGGGIYNKGTLTMEDCTISENRVQWYGGGVLNRGTLTITGGTISDNTTWRSGGGIYNDGGTATITGCTIKSCKVAVPGTGDYKYGGAGIYITGGGSLTAKGCEITENTVTADSVVYGGGVFVYEGTFTMEDGTKISKNRADWDGGGVYVAYSDSTFIMNGGEISGNHGVLRGDEVLAEYKANTGGGGVCVTEGGTFTMNHGTINGNTSGTVGGGVYVAKSNYYGAGTFTMKGGTISENTASEDGGGVYVYQESSSYTTTFTMEGGTIEKNEANYGGGVYVNGGAFTMTKGTISGNTAGGNGGGVYNNGGTFTQGGTVSGNSPDDVYPAP